MPDAPHPDRLALAGRICDLDERGIAIRIIERFEEYPRHEAGAEWVHDVLRPILDRHPHHAGACTTCLAREPESNGIRFLAPYPCPTTQEIMDAVAFTAWELAHDAVAALIEAAVAAGGVRPLTVLRRPRADLPDCFAFEAVYRTRGIMLHLPGLDLAELRPGPDGSIKGLTRVRAEGSTWVWPIAVSVLVCASRAADAGRRVS